MAETASTVQLLSPEGVLQAGESADQYLPYIESLGDDQLRAFHRDMVITRRFDVEATNLQRQGQLALWPPSHGQEAAQVGSAYALRSQDHVFPSYREHAVGLIRGIDAVDIIRLMRGITNGGWDPAENGNFHLYTLVLGSQTLHATGYAMGVGFDGTTATGDPETDEAVIVYSDAIDALEGAREWAQEEPRRAVVVAGSIVLVGQAMAYAEEQEWKQAAT